MNVLVRDLQRGALGRQRCETHNVGEEDGDRRVGLRDHWFTHPQFEGHRPEHKQVW